MNTHSFTSLLRQALVDSQPGLNIYTPVMADNRSLPFALLTLYSGEEKIPRNHTWECELEIQVHTNAHDQSEDTARQFLSGIQRLVLNPALLESLNKSAEDFFLYRIALLAVDAPQAMDNTFIQTARFRVMIQF